MCGKSLSRVQLFAISLTIESMEFSRPEYWSGQSFPSQGELPNPGIKPRSPTLQADSLPTEPLGKPQKYHEKNVKSLSHVQLFVIPWTIAYHTPPTMRFSRQEYWSRLPIPSPEDLSDPWIEPRSPELQADALLSEPKVSQLTLILYNRIILYIIYKIPQQTIYLQSILYW